METLNIDIVSLIIEPIKFATGLISTFINLII